METEFNQAQERQKVIDNLDFKLIKEKLTNSNNLDWSDQLINLVESEYKKFLRLNLMYPNENLVPSESVDEFWHYHILDTRKYSSDCEKVFGYYLHHFPYFGMRGEQDKIELDRSFEKTKKLHRQLFGEEMLIDIAQIPSGCSPGGAANL